MNGTGVYDQAIILQTDLASRIVESARKAIAYDINIMNEDGYIIAGTDGTRIGSFHEVAYRIINSDDDIIEAEDTNNLIGTKPGINMVLKHKSHRFGVLGITGAPDQVRPVASVLKLAVETMIDYELQQRKYQRQRTRQGIIDAVILQGASPSDDLPKIFEDMGISVKPCRLPAVLIPGGDIAPTVREKVEYALREHVRAQDIVTNWDNGSITVFVAFRSNPEACTTFRFVIPSYWEEPLAILAREKIEARVFVGSFCRHYERYFESYRRAVWLAGLRPRPEERIVYFIDHLRAWAHTFLPVTDLHEVFSTYTKDLDENTLAQMCKVEQALTDTNYNMVNASALLFVHKNTLALWLNSYRKTFSIDPIHSSADRIFWRLLCLYCSINNR